MTEVTFRKLNKGYEVIIEGHANYNPGNDIVCSACSVLAYTLDNTLSKKGITHSTQIGSGYMRIEINEDRAISFVEMAAVGYMTLENSYPDNVRLFNEIV